VLLGKLVLLRAEVVLERLAVLGRRRLVLELRRGRVIPALAPQAAEERAPLLARPRGRHVAVRRLADPALVVGPRRAQLADELALPTGREICLGALTFEDCPATDSA
jgi:hypothetical protein